MEKRKWPWKRKSSERSGGESESSESFSSHSERFSDELEAMRESGNENMPSPEVSSQTAIADGEDKESVKSLIEKLSAALVNVSAKEDLVKQHAKVAEEAVVGWEKAENEVSALKQQLEAALQQNLSLEVKNSHLDGALKECVRQLRQAKDEQEKRVSDAMSERSREWESTRADFEKRILDLQEEVESSACVDPATLLILAVLEKENSSLKLELVSCCKELEVVTIERDLSVKAAESASKLQLETIRKVAKLEAECRRLQFTARKSSPLSSQKSVPAESLTVSRSDSGESGCLDLCTSIIIPELDHFKNEKPSTKGGSCSLQVDMMDDFLEMERLAALPEAKSNAPMAAPEPASGEASLDNPLKSELDSMTQRVADLEDLLEKTEAQNLELQNALDETAESLKAAQNRIAQVEIKVDELQNELTEVYETKKSLEFQLESMEVESRTLSLSVDSLQAEIEDGRKLAAAQNSEFQNALNETVNSLQVAQNRIAEAESRVEELHNELTAVYETKESLELQLGNMEVESRNLSSSVDSLKAEIEKERKLSAEVKKKCRELESELSSMIQEYELQQSMQSNGELKVKQEDLAVAADKLAECQKTIASLGRQLQSLATLEDFFIDTSHIPGFSRDPLDSDTGGMWRLPSNGTSVPSYESAHPVECYGHLANGNRDSSRSSFSSPSLTNHATSAKHWNGFGKIFSRSKSAVEHENGQE